MDRIGLIVAFLIGFCVGGLFSDYQHQHEHHPIPKEEIHANAT